MNYVYLHSFSKCPLPALKRLFVSCITISILASCGGSDTHTHIDGPKPGEKSEVSSNTTSNPSGVLTGIFLDSPVENLAYNTVSQSGFTDENGRFSYRAGESVVFSIGNVELPSTVAKPIITPIDLFANGAINHRGVVNVSRLLQSFDEDSNTTNGIVIAERAHTLQTIQPVDFESNDFSETALALIETSDVSGLPLIPASTAIEHLGFSLSAAGLPITEADNGQPLILRDSDFNGIPDDFDWDDDGDGVNDKIDVFPYDSSEQFDFDNDGIGNNSDLDDDNDGTEDSLDAFPNVASETKDTDHDGIGDNTDPDIDNDGVPNSIDVFPLDSSEQFDFDGDGIGNNTDPDDDNDGTRDTLDLFAFSASEQTDADNDGIGDRADNDDDNDGVADFIDLFPLDHTEHSDYDRDGIGNNADNDDDNDGVADELDAFPFSALENSDSDNDGIGDNADLDDDNDGTLDSADAFLLNAHEQLDFDGDGIGNGEDTDDDNDGIADMLDAFPYLASESKDTDQDGIGDNADLDIDNDGVVNSLDQFPLDNTEQFDFDNDGIGNNADPDDDNDGVADTQDLFVFSANEQFDADGDGLGDQADHDDDNDGVPDINDLFPLDSDEHSDFDQDGVGNNADPDDDNDGVADLDDAFPFAVTEHSDSDSDGIGDNIDVDDDNDGVHDTADEFPLDSGEHQDSDGDGIGNNADPDDDGDGIPDESDPDSVTVSNTPPELTVLRSLSFSYTANGFASVSVTDTDNNAISLSWSVISGPPSGDLTITPETNAFRNVQLHATVAGLYEYAVRATDGIDNTYETFTVEVTNSAPVIPDIAVVLAAQPEGYVADGTEKAHQPLFASHDPFTDPDGQWETYKYTWAVNDVELVDLPPHQRVLDNLYFKRGDTVKVELEVFDGINTTTATSPATVIVNDPPIVGITEILPADAGTTDELNISFGSFDNDDDDIDFSFQWTINGSVLVNHTDSILPAGVAKFFDVVTAQVIADDGFDTTSSNPVSMTITDTPSTLNTNALPSTLSYGETAEFTAFFSDPDGTDVSTVLLEAPQGMSYDPTTGAVSWTPTPLMFTDNETYSVQFASSDDQTVSIDLVVTNPDRQPLLARSGIEVPRNNANLDIGDFDGDGINEILGTDSFGKVFTLELDGEQINQDWLYPYPLLMNDDSIIGLWSHGLNSSEIIVVTSNGVNHIESKNQPPINVYESIADIETADFVDIDNDAVKDLILITDLGELVVLSTENWQQKSPTITLNSDDPNYIARFNLVVGNVDADTQLEIVTSTGEVIDSATWTVEWQHIADFGLHLAIGDVDGDGNNEILAGSRWSGIVSYDAITQSSIWTYDINDTCGLALYNADSDPQDEIFHGPCQHGELEVYDGASGTVVLQNTFDHPTFSSAFTSFSFGDIDSDGVDEIIFATGTGSSGADQMGIASFSGLGDTATLVTNYNPAQLGSYAIAGWDSTTNSLDTAVFVLDSANFHLGGKHVALLDDGGDLSLSSTVASNFSPTIAAALVDSNGDGVTEILLAADDFPGEKLFHINLDDFTQIHSYDDLGSTEIFAPDIKSVAIGIAEDGSRKAILATSERKLQIYDIASMQSDWLSGLLDGTFMSGAIAINHDTGFDILAATNTELTLWAGDATGYSRVNTASASCSELLTFDTAEGTQIACIGYSIFTRKSRITLFNLQLVKQSEIDIEGEIDAVLDNESGHLLIARELENDNNEDENRLQLINPYSGHTLWSSTPLLGKVTGMKSIANGLTGAQRLAISTDSAMYIIRQ